MNLKEIIRNYYEKGRQLKNSASSLVGNYKLFLDAATAYNSAAEKLKEYISSKNEDLDTAYFYLTISEYEIRDCYYSYFIKDYNYEKAIEEANQAIGILNNAKIQLDSRFSRSKNFEIYKKEVFYLLELSKTKQLEPYAKKHLFSREFEEALSFYKKIASIYEGIDSSNVTEERLRNLELNYIISQFNFSNCLYRISNKLAHEDVFYLISGIKHLLKTLEIGKRVTLISEDPFYKDGLKELIKQLNIIIKRNHKIWNLLLQEFWNEQIIIDIINQHDPNFVANFNPNGGQIEYILVFMIHGFNTRGVWKNDFAEILSADTDNNVQFIPAMFDYGDFKFRKFINPMSRRWAVEQFHVFYNDRMLRYANLNPKVCIVSHSFGTYLTRRNLERFNEVYFERIILLGSIIRRNYIWDNHKASRKIDIIRCELYKMDRALLAAFIYQLLVPWVWWLGISGSFGFKNKRDYVIEIGNAFGGHSDMFGGLNMRNNWIPFLKS
jgi:hypothetical protein